MRPTHPRPGGYRADMEELWICIGARIHGGSSPATVSIDLGLLMHIVCGVQAALFLGRTRALPCIWGSSIVYPRATGHGCDGDRVGDDSTLCGGADVGPYLIQGPAGMALERGQRDWT